MEKIMETNITQYMQQTQFITSGQIGLSIFLLIMMLLSFTLSRSCA